MSEKVKPSLLERLSKVQSELKAPKDQQNKFGGYNYRSCEDILEAVKPLLVENDLVLMLSDELVQVGERYYIKATASLNIVEDNGTWHDVTAYAREEETKKGMDGSQITGAASSYARKYALNGLFLIDDTEDADATNDNGKAGMGATKPYTPKPRLTAPEPSTDAPDERHLDQDLVRKLKTGLLACRLTADTDRTAFYLSTIGKPTAETNADLTTLIEALDQRRIKQAKQD